VKELKIGIIGGGVGGLSAAYYLQNRRSADDTTIYRCTVYDKSHRVGGNACSAYLGAEPFTPPFVDLAVNDFNERRYVLLMEILERLEKHGFPVAYAPIVDTTTWYTAAGAQGRPISYTERELEAVLHGERPPAGKEYLEEVADDWANFEKAANKVLHDPEYATMSVETFMCEEGYSEAFRQYNLLARINGMYYCTDRGPLDMPIRAVMSYYHLQEGLGGDESEDAIPASNLGKRHLRKKHGHDHEAAKTDRRYFMNGASDWIHQLCGWLDKEGTSFVTGVTPTAIRLDDGRWEVTAEIDGKPRSEIYDLLISAVYAEEVPKVIKKGLSDPVTSLLAEFSYTDSLAIVHEDTTMMPAQVDQWSTYNILIYPQETVSLRPYTITYVTRKHQGEHSNEPPYLTLSPLTPIGCQTVPEMLDLASAEQPTPTIKATQYFRHNLITTKSMEAQSYLHDHQGDDGLYFTGGWTYGAGLHEEILTVSEDIARIIRGFERPYGPAGYRHDDADHVPPMLRRTRGEKIPLFPEDYWR